VKAFVKDLVTDDMIPFKDFSYLYYVIHDGYRIELYNDYPVTTKASHSSEFIRACIMRY
jgi:hypothetical protein